MGSGTQLLFMAAGLLLLSSVGVLNPSFRGGYISVGVGLFLFAGLFSGYFSARLFKTFGGTKWRRNVIVTAVLFPGLTFCLLFILNLFVWAQASSTAIPFSTLVGLVVLWLLIQVPLVYVGGWCGYDRTRAWEHPTRTDSIVRQIPPQPWYLRTLCSSLFAGLIPFAVLLCELLSVFRSLWMDKSGYYYMFGFLAIISSLLVVIIAEVTVIVTYNQLCAENHAWWWQSFFTGAGSAVWVFVYSVYYYMFKLHVSGFVSGLCFFSYCFLASVVYGILAGTIGFLASYAFARRIYR